MPQIEQQGKRSLPSNRMRILKIRISRVLGQRLDELQRRNGSEHHGGAAETIRLALRAGLDALNVPRPEH